MRTLAPGTFWRSVRLVGATLLFMLAVQLLPAPLQTADLSAFEQVRRTLRKRGLNAEARAAQVAGYYEDLLDRSADVVAPAPTTLTAWFAGPGNTGRPKHEVVTLSAKVPPINDFSRGFLIYTPKKNLRNLPDPRFPGFAHETNSWGFADREYPVERTAASRRVVILGDSIARALGVPIDRRFDALLEDRLNERHLNHEVRRYEIINMGVSGFRITQIVDYGLEIAPAFKPDLYIIALTELTVGTRWDNHLAQIFDEGRDLKYPFLKQVVEQAGLKRGESAATMRAKLAPFRLPTLRWVLQQIRGQAQRDGALVTVLLLPTLDEVGELDRIFRPVRPLLEQEGLPYVDLLDSLGDADLKQFDAGDGGHVNAAGQRLMFERLYRRILAQESLSTRLRLW